MTRQPSSVDVRLLKLGSPGYDCCCQGSQGLGAELPVTTRSSRSSRYSASRCTSSCHCDKMFCGCTTFVGRQSTPGDVSVCLGLPGSLPVLNRAAVESAIRIGLALNCEIVPSVASGRTTCPRTRSLVTGRSPSAATWTPLEDGTTWQVEIERLTWKKTPRQTHAPHRQRTGGSRCHRFADRKLSRLQHCRSSIVAKHSANQCGTFDHESIYDEFTSAARIRYLMSRWTRVQCAVTPTCR